MRRLLISLIALVGLSACGTGPVMDTEQKKTFERVFENCVSQGRSYREKTIEECRKAAREIATGRER